MSAFEFFFSFYGLLLGFSVAVVATGLVLAIQHRKTVRIGWMTPLLAVFVALDIASFWDQAWTNFQHLPFSYGLLVAGLVIAVTYFVAASMVFPLKLEDVGSLDDHFWANRKIVLLLLIVANVMGVAASLAANLGRESGMRLILTYGVTLMLYVGLTLPAAFARAAPGRGHARSAGRHLSADRGVLGLEPARGPGRQGQRQDRARAVRGVALTQGR